MTEITILPLYCYVLCVCYTRTHTHNQLFSLFLLLIGLILSAVGTGLDQWSQFNTERRDPDSGIIDGGTSKTQGLLRRCVVKEICND